MPRRGEREFVQHSPWEHVSYVQSVAIREKKQRILTVEQLTAENMWGQVAFADPATPVILSDFLRTNFVDDVDMIKIDVDGPDFDILQSFPYLNRHNGSYAGMTPIMRARRSNCR